MIVAYTVIEEFGDCGMCGCVFGEHCQYDIHTGFRVEEREVPQDSPLVFVAKIAEELGIPVYFKDNLLRINPIHGCAPPSPYPSFYSVRSDIDGRCLVDIDGAIHFSKDDTSFHGVVRSVSARFVLGDDYGVRHYLSENFK